MMPRHHDIRVRSVPTNACVRTGTGVVGACAQCVSLLMLSLVGPAAVRAQLRRLFQLVQEPGTH